MIDTNFREFKKLFFDRAKIIRAMNKATRQALSKAGAFIRTRARTSMKYRKGASIRGTPPHAHRQGRGALLRKFLFFGYEPGRQSVVIGPTALPGKKPEAAPLNEFGGTAGRTRTVREVRRKATPAQARAFRQKLLTKQIILPKASKTTVVARYPQRSFMGPALKEEVKAGTIPNQWANSIKRG